MFLKEFEIRCSDIDANKHLSNISYITYAVETRMEFLRKIGLNHNNLKEMNLGSVVFNEHIYYYKEVLLDQKIKVSFEINGTSDDRKFFQYEHNFYNSDGENVAFYEMTGAWMDLVKRKLTVLPKKFSESLTKIHKTKNFKIISSKDTRIPGKNQRLNLDI